MQNDELGGGVRVAGTIAMLDHWLKRRGPKLGQAFDPRMNALNAWRLVLATGVVLWHSWPLTGREMAYPPAAQLLNQVWVDGFFALSGFLITRSWLRNPRLGKYFLARGLRIFPGLWVCLCVVAFVIAPVAVTIQGDSAAKLLKSTAPIEYVLNNAVLNVFYLGIGGTPRDVPWSGVWNGPLYTLVFEVMCYIVVACLGIAGLAGRRWVSPVAFTLALVGAQMFSFPIRAELGATLPQLVSRFALMFAAGALLYHFQDVIPARWSLVAVSFVVVLASGLLPNYRVIGAIPLAYAVIVSGSLIQHKRLNLRTDLSYGTYIYAWPVQQVLVICGLGFLNPMIFGIVSAVATLPLAALSWFLVEKRALSLKSGLRLKRRTGTAPARESVVRLVGGKTD
jgi:peptidoglycan/LPS O-acetylase OafA/YrhL